MKYFKFRFRCEDKFGYIRDESYVHKTEFDARRELIHTLIGLYNFYPKKLTLLSVENFDPSVWSFD